MSLHKVESQKELGIESSKEKGSTRLNDYWTRFLLLLSPKYIISSVSLPILEEFCCCWTKITIMFMYLKFATALHYFQLVTEPSTL